MAENHANLFSHCLKNITETAHVLVKRIFRKVLYLD